MLKRIGAEEGGEFKAIASGTLPCGKPVIVNADGTVSAPSGNDTGAGTPVEVSSADYLNDAQAVYDPDTGKIVIAYHRDASNHYYGAAIVGTISGTSISFGSEVKFQANNTQGMNGLSMCYDTSQDKIFIAYGDKQNSQYAACVVGTVSGTSISFGTTVIVNSESVSRTACEFDSSNNKILLAYRRGNAQGGAEVITLSGSSISSGSVTVFNSGNIRRPALAFSTTANKFVLVYKDYDQSQHGKYRVATISGTSVSYGSEAAFNSVSSEKFSITYDASIDKFLAVYRDSDDSNKVKARVGTLSGTTVSWGSIAVVSSGNATFPCVESKGDGTAVITFSDFTTTPVANPRFVVATISGTSVSFSSAVTVAADVNSESGSIGSLNYVAYDTANEKFVYPYNDMPSGQAANSTLDAAVLQTESTTLTSENYIGMSSGPASPAVSGTKVTFESGTMGSEHIGVVYDPDVGRIILAYQDESNSYYGQAVVGTVSGTSISFGTPVVFESAKCKDFWATYDTANDKVVIAFCDEADSDKGKGIVGTVSGTSISFGSAATFNSGSTNVNGLVYDTNAGKVVVVYRDSGNSNRGTAAVGTVSGTSISFGAEALFNGNAGGYNATAVYDSTAQKIVIAVMDTGNSSYGTGIVGTVSGTDITFGSATTFNSVTTQDIGIAYDSSNNKTVITYKDGSNGDKGMAVVGTVSGTGISFGTPVEFVSRVLGNHDPVYHSETGKIVINYQSYTSISKGRYITGTVSGTTIGSFSSPVAYYSDDNAILIPSVVVDGATNNLVFAWKENTGSTGNAVVASLESRGEVADGGHALLDTQGSISDNQGGLTAGQSYFVQTDGTLSTTAGDPSVFAGTAVSATKLIVKG